MAAGQQKLQIEISAVDRVTAQVNKINKSLDKIAAGPKRVAQSLSQLSEASGLTKFGNALKGVGAAAARVGSQIKGAVERVAEIAGIGGMAALAGLTYEWSKLGLEITRTSDRLGLTTTQLQQIRNVGVASGAGLEATSQAFEAMGTTLEDATYGRNRSALTMMAMLNIRLHRLAGGAVDAKEGILELADAIQAQGGNRQAQALIANQFGAGALLPELLKGRVGMEAYFQMVDKYSMSTEQVKRADDFALKLNEGRLAADQLRNSIGDGLIPVFQPLIQRFIDWENIAGNRDKLVGAISSGVAWLVDKIPKLVTAIGNFVDAIGGWKTVAVIFGASIAASVLAPIASLTASLVYLGVTAIPLGLRALMYLGHALPIDASLTGLGAFAAGFLALATAITTFYAAFKSGSWIYDKIANTSFANALGAGVAGVMAKLGSSEAQAALDRNNTNGNNANNPGNLRKWYGVPTAGGFAKFSTQSQGLDAMAKQLQLYATRDRIDTISGIVKKYSPDSDGNNSAVEIPQIASWSGFDANQHLNFNDSSTLSKVMSAMIRKEGHSAATPQTAIDSAAEKATHIKISFDGLPKGTTARVTSPNGNVSAPNMSGVGG